LCLTQQRLGGSAARPLAIAVENLAGLISLTRDNYSGRLVDILDIRLT
jgi:hypothetical protein